jgi:hypothetical protein
MMAAVAIGACSSSSSLPGSSGHPSDAGGSDRSVEGGLGSDSSSNEGGPGNDSGSEASSPTVGGWGAAEAVTIQGWTGTSTEDLRVAPQGYLLFDNHTNDSSTVQMFWATPGSDYKTFVFQGQIGGDLADSTQYLIDPSLDSMGHFFYTHAASGTPKLYVGNWSSSLTAHQAAVTGSAALTGTTSGSQVNMDGFVSDSLGTSPATAPPGLYTDLVVFNQYNMPSSAQIAFASPAPGPQAWALQSSTVLSKVNAVGPVLYNAIPSPSMTEVFFTYANYGSKTMTIWESAWSAGAFDTPVQIASTGTESENGSMSLDGHHLYFHTFPNGSTNPASPSVVSR